MDFFQFTVADMQAVEDLIQAKDCLHFKDCCDKISLDNMLLDLDAFDGWQNTRQESDHSVPPDQLSYAWPLKGNIRGEGILDISLAAKPLRYASTTATFSSRDTLSPEFAEMPKAAQRRQHWLPKLDHKSLLDAEPPSRKEYAEVKNEIVVHSEAAEAGMMIVETSPLRSQRVNGRKRQTIEESESNTHSPPRPSQTPATSFNRLYRKLTS